MQIQNEDEQRQFLLSGSQRDTLSAEERAVLSNAKLTPMPTEQQHKQIIHKVVYGDTLQGLSLEYSVPMSRIKQRNHIDGDYIYHLKEIIIPNPQTIPLPKERTQEIMIEEFVAHMNYSEKDRKVARYYLEDTDWNMDEAMKEYASDLQWQRKNKQAIVSHNLVEGKSEMKQIKRYYEMQELRHKKTN